MMCGALPFYYYDKFSGEEKRSILSSLGKPQAYEAALEEYAEHSSHSIHLTDQELVCGLAGGTSGSPDLQKIIGNSTGRCTVLTGTDAASY